MTGGAAPMMSSGRSPQNRWTALVVLAVLATFAPGCDDGRGDDTSLPPQERAARFKAFAKKGMTYAELTDRFAPTRYQFGVVENGQHVGGTFYMDWTSDKFERDRKAINHDGYTLQYKWSKDPLVFHEV